MYNTANTSRSPCRVAFSSPDCGENPIVVSTLRPPAMAHIDELPPRWQLTSFTCRPSIAATRSPPPDFLRRSAVEAVLHPAVLQPPGRHAVAPRVFGHGRVELRLEGRHNRHSRHGLPEEIGRAHV